MKNMIALAIVILIRIICSDCAAQIPNGTVTSTYSSDYETKRFGGTVVVNRRNSILTKQKISYNMGEVDISGFFLKDVQKNINTSIKSVLNSSEKNEINVNQNIGAVLFIRKNGQIDEVAFHIPVDSKITYKTLEKMEDTILKTRVPVKNLDKTKKIDFVPINIVIKSNEIL